MDFEQIEVVLAIARKMSFSEAAYDISMSSSSVSRQLNSLEEELGVRLFHRNAKSKVFLSKEGEKLLPYFKNLMRMHDQIRREAEILKGKSGELRLLSLPDVPIIDSGLLLDVMKKKPNTKFLEYRLPDDQALEYLICGKADVGIATSFGPIDENSLFSNYVKNEGLIIHPILVENGYVLLNKKHPLASRDGLTLMDIATQPNTELVFSAFYEENAVQRVKVVEEWARKNRTQISCRALNAYIGTSSETLNAYVKGHPESITLVRNILLRNDACVKIPFWGNNLYFTTFIYYLKGNHSEVLKCFIECANKLSKTPAEER